MKELLDILNVTGIDIGIGINLGRIAYKLFGINRNNYTLNQLANVSISFAIVRHPFER